jgi:hypothetical protein
MTQCKIVRTPYQASKSVWYVVRGGSFIGGPFLRRDEAALFIKSLAR